MTESEPRVESAGDVQAELTFIVPQEAKPYFESSALTGGDPKIYFDTEQHTVTIRDMREVAPAPTLDRSGFELLTRPTAVRDFYDDDEVRDVYERELVALLQQATGADRVVTFDYTRRSDAPSGAANPDGMRGPASRAHVDYTVASGPMRAGDILGEEQLQRILAAGGHVVQVNVWRPISGPVRRTPLALADAGSLAEGELVATEQVFPDRVGEIYLVAYGPSQRWFWAPRMERDEVLLIKGWDSRDDARVTFAPHSAFQLPGQPDAPPRESIEVRTYLLFEGAG